MVVRQGSILERFAIFAVLEFQLTHLAFVMFQEIFSSWTHKTDHFQKLKQRTGVPYNEMLFFDDEDRNIQAVRSPAMLLNFILEHVNTT